MQSVLVAVAAELFQLQPLSGFLTVFGGSVATDPGRTLVRVGAALCALQGNNDAVTFGFSHTPSQIQRQSFIIHFFLNGINPCAHLFTGLLAQTAGVLIQILAHPR